MPIKDYSKFFSMDGGLEKSNYSVIFKKEQPEIDNYINLKTFRGWVKSGDKGYKILTALSKEKLENFIIEELKIDKDDFQIVVPYENAWIKW